MIFIVKCKNKREIRQIRQIHSPAPLDNILRILYMNLDNTQFAFKKGLSFW